MAKKPSWYVGHEFGLMMTLFILMAVLTLVAVILAS